MIKRIFLVAIFATVYTSVNYAQFANDISLTKIKMPEYAQYSEEHVMGVFKNNGTDSLFSMDIFWQANGGRIYKYEKDNFAIRSGQNWIFTHPDKVKLNSSQNYNIKVWVSNPNGLQDENPDNDTITHTIQVIEKFPERKILIEEITGAWCGYCPRAPIIINKTIKPAYPQVIMVAIHTGDAMAIDESGSLRSAYVSGVPTGFVSREVARGYSNVSLSPESWIGRLEDIDLEFNPVDLSVYNYYYPETREWKVDVVADFVLDTEGDYRFNIYVIEDSLTGSGSRWNQRNFYNNSASEPYMELKGAGDPIPGYVHNHVVRKMTGGSWGMDGIIPDTVKRGDRYVYSETFTIPDSWRPENLYLIGIIQEYNSDKAKRPILNARESELSLATGIKPIIELNSIYIYPNPVTDQALLEIETSKQESFNFEIFNNVGQSVVKSVTHKIDGEKSFIINTSGWTQGIYFIKTLLGEDVEVLKLIKE